MILVCNNKNATLTGIRDKFKSAVCQIFLQFVKVETRPTWVGLSFSVSVATLEMLAD